MLHGFLFKISLVPAVLGKVTLCIATELFLQSIVLVAILTSRFNHHANANELRVTYYLFEQRAFYLNDEYLLSSCCSLLVLPMESTKKPFQLSLLIQTNGRTLLVVYLISEFGLAAATDCHYDIMSYAWWVLELAVAKAHRNTINITNMQSLFRTGYHFLKCKIPSFQSL